MKYAGALLVVFTLLFGAMAPGLAFAAKHAPAQAARAGAVPAEPEAAATAETHAEEGSGQLPQLDASRFPGQIFWLVVTFAFTYVMMRYVAIPGVEKTLQKREAAISTDIEQARELNEQVKQISADLELRMNDARSRAADQVREAMGENAAKLAAAFADQQKKLDTDLKAAEAQLTAQKQAAIAALDSEAAGMIEAILKRVTGTAPANDVLKSAWNKAKEA